MRDLSLVIPVHDESGAILPLLTEIHGSLRATGLDYEVIVVDDASTDGTGSELQSARRFLNRLRVVTHAARAGQSAALQTGVRHARSPWVATLDGDGQNDPADVAKLWRVHQASPEVAMVCGQRVDRKDSWVKRRASRIANRVRGALLGDGIADTGCGLKLVSRDLYLRLPAFDHMHRFLPALAQAQGAIVETVPVGHRARSAGRSKYGVVDRFLEGLLDLVGVWWLQHRRLAPRVEREPVARPADASTALPEREEALAVG